MVNFSLYLSGPKMRVLMALVKGEPQQWNSVLFNSLSRERLVVFKKVPSEAEGISVDAPFITERGQVVAALFQEDIEQYLMPVRAKKRN